MIWISQATKPKEEGEERKGKKEEHDFTYVALKEYFLRIMSWTSHKGLFSVRYSRRIVALCVFQSSFVAHMDSESLAPEEKCMAVQSRLSPGDGGAFNLAFPRIFSGNSTVIEMKCHVKPAKQSPLKDEEVISKRKRSDYVFLRAVGD